MEGGNFIPYPKEKHGVIPLGEDSYLTSESSLVVCDGVGGNNFSSHYFSELLTLFHQQTVHLSIDSTIKPSSQIDKIKLAITKSHQYSINEYKNLVIQHLKQIHSDSNSTEGIQKINDSLNELRSSSTYVSATLVNYEGEKSKVVFANQGDSKGVIYRVKAYNDKSYYVPVSTTKEQQAEFNCPSQISAIFGVDYQEEVKYTVKDVQSFDIVLLGSDGVFDNIHYGFLIMILNSILVYSSESEINAEYVFHHLLQYAFAYLEILKKKSWVVYDYYAEGKKYTLDEENNLTDGSNVKRPNLIKKFWKLIVQEPIPRIPENENSFGPFLSKLSETFTSKSPIEDRIKKAFNKFFECPIIKMIDLKSSSNRGEYNNPCIEEVLKEHLHFSTDEHSKVASFYSSSKTSEIIAKFSKFFATLWNYQSNYYLHGWKDKVQYLLTNRFGSGKDDDITAVAAMILLRDSSKGDYEIEYHRKLMYKKLLWNSSFQKDVFSFDRFLNGKSVGIADQGIEKVDISNLKNKLIINNLPETINKQNIKENNSNVKITEAHLSERNMII